MNGGSIVAVDMADGSELEGATIQIIDSNGNVVDEWTSGKKAHGFQGLKTGEEYTLRVTVIPDGYQNINDHVFSIDEEGQITFDGSLIEGSTLQIMLQKIPSYTITLVESENGTLSFADGSSSPAVEGTKISLIIEPTDGCELDTVTVTGDSGQSYDYDKESQSFSMPAENVTVSASYKISELLNGALDLPQTGDHTRMGLWLAVCLMSCAGMLARHLRVRISNKEN